MSNSMNPVIETRGYSECVAATKLAVQADAAAGAKYKTAGAAVAAMFESREAFEQVKAQFCADAIIPALSQGVRNALALKLPRKGTPEADAFEGLEEAKARLKSARDTVQVYFGRIASYAFPKPKAKAKPKAKTEPANSVSETEGDADKADGKTPAEKLASMSTVFAAAAKVLERDADAFRAALPGFDPAACGAHVMAALAEIVNAQAAQAKPEATPAKPAKAKRSK